MTTVFEDRAEFGSWLRKLRNEAGQSLRDTEQLTGVTYSMISAIECGEKAIGADVAVKLADALTLTGEQRDQFLMKAAGTRKKDRLVGYARTLAPEIVNYVAKALIGAGVNMQEIKSCKFQRGNNSETTPSATQDQLVLEMENGRTLVCSLVMEGKA